MKRAGGSHRGGLWGDDKVETGRNVFECVLSAVHLWKSHFVNQITLALVEDSIDSSMASQPSSLYHSLKRLPHALTEIKPSFRLIFQCYRWLCDRIELVTVFGNTLYFHALMSAREPGKFTEILHYIIQTHFLH